MAEYVGAVTLGVNLAGDDIASQVNSIGQKSGGILKNILSGAFSFASGQAIYSGITSALDKFVESVKDGVTYASDLNEVANVIDVTFGSASTSVVGWADKASTAFGMTQLAAEQYAGSMGAMLKSSGVAADATVTMSEKLVGLSGDMASFYNISQSDAWEKIRSGISGETEPLKQLGINMDVANLSAYALSQGIKTSYDKMTQAQQVQLRYNYLLSVTKDAQGDFTRTSSSFANQQRILQNNWQALTGTIASAAIPVLNEGAQVLNGVLSGALGNVQTEVTGVSTKLSAFISTHQGQITGFVTGLVAGIKDVLTITGNIMSFVTSHGPLVVGVIGTIVGAMTAYKTVTMTANAITEVSNWLLVKNKIASEGIAAGQKVLTAAKGGTTLATLSLNTATVGHTISLVAHAVATNVSAAAQWVLNGAFLACPITWIVLGIMAVIAVVLLLVTHWSQVRAFFAGLWQDIIGIFAAAWSWLNSGTGQWVTAIVAIFLPMIGIPLLIAEHWGQIKTFFVALWISIISFFTNIPARFGALINQIGNFFATLPQRIGFALGFALGSIIKFGVNAAVWATTAVPQLITNIGTFIETLPARLWTTLLLDIQKLHDFEWSIINWGATAIPQFLDNVVGFFETLPGRIWSAIIGAVTGLANWGGQMLSTAKSAASNVASGIVGFFTGLPGQLLNIGHNIVQGLWDGITGAWHMVTDGINNLTGGFISGFKSALGIHSPSTVMAGLGGYLSEGLANGIAGSSGLVQNAMDGISSIVTVHPGLLAGATVGASAMLASGLAAAKTNITNNNNNTKAPVININGPVNVTDQGNQKQTLQQLQFLASV